MNKFKYSQKKLKFQVKDICHRNDTCLLHVAGVSSAAMIPAPQPGCGQRTPPKDSFNKFQF